MALGIPVGELQRRITAREFAEYMVFAGIEPLPGRRADLLMGTVASLLANVHRDPQRRGDPFTANEFAPDWWSDKPKTKTPEEIFLQFKVWARISGKKA